MERPLTYRGGAGTIFQRAESAAFFGREIGLMYVHSPLRHAEAMGVPGEAQARQGKNPFADKSGGGR